MAQHVTSSSVSCGFSVGWRGARTASWGGPGGAGSTGGWANPPGTDLTQQPSRGHEVKGMGLTLQVILQLTVQCILLRVTMLGLDVTSIRTITLASGAPRGPGWPGQVGSDPCSVFSISLCASLRAALLRPPPSLCASPRAAPTQTSSLPAEEEEAWCSFCGDDQKVMFLLCFLGTLLFTHKCLRHPQRWVRQVVSLQVLGKNADIRGASCCSQLSGLLLPPFQAHQCPPASLSPWAWPGFPFQLVAQPQAPGVPLPSGKS